MGLLITFFLGIFIIAGAVIAKSVRNTKLIEQLSISVAFGTMLALVVMDLLPEAFEHLNNEHIFVLPVCVVLGIVLLKLLDFLIPEHDHAHGFEHECSDENVIHIGIISSVAVILHNVIEGMSVYSISTQSTRLGLLIALGVGLHNIPMGMVIYSTLRKESRRKKLILFFAVFLSTFIGGLIMKTLWSAMNDFVIGILISLTLGMILYIVAFELLPHLMHAKKKWLSLIGALIGVIVIVISSLLH